MDPVYRKAQNQISGSTSKAGSKGSSRKARKKKRAPNTQNAGQPSGPGGSVSTSERSRSRATAGRQNSSASATAVDSDSPSKAALFTTGSLHVIDIGLGLALVIYGGMVHVAQVTALSIFYGLVLLLGAIAGSVGYFSGACNRRGLVGSAVAGALGCLLDLIAFIAVLVSWDSFMNFLNDNQSDLGLTEDSVKSIQGLKVLFAVIFLVLAVLEAYRFRVMWEMKDTMRGTSARVSPNSASSNDSAWNRFLGLFGLSKRKKTDDMVLFDDNASMESSLLWSKDGAQPSSDDYLEFVPEHERGLAEYASNIALPVPPEEKDDY